MTLLSAFVEYDTVDVLIKQTGATRDLLDFHPSYTHR